MAAAGAVTFFTGLGAIFASFASRTDVLRTNQARAATSSARDGHGRCQSAASPTPTAPPRGCGTAEALPDTKQEGNACQTHKRLSFVLNRRFDIWMRFVFRTLGCEKASRTLAELRARVWRVRRRREPVGEQAAPLQGTPWGQSQHSHHGSVAGLRGWGAARLFMLLARCPSSALPALRLYFTGDGGMGFWGAHTGVSGSVWQ